MPTLIIHGGAGLREGRHAKLAEYAKHLSEILSDSYPVLVQEGARSAILHAIRLLEDDPLFNAGTGSRLQEDGQARMSAALMDSHQQKLAGVINIEKVRHPIELADHLSAERYSMLCGAQATQYARQLGIPEYDPITSHRQQELIERRSGKTGTVGAVAVDQDHVICAGTSTGGVGFETPGRVSDSATVAGTYASSQAGISCTGIGEHIVNHAVAARIVTRVEDGLSLATALDKTITEANQRRYHYGLIGLDSAGNWSVGQTRGITTLFAAHDGTQTTIFDH